MNKNLNKALEDALEQEFSRFYDFDNPYEEYEFSSQFEQSIKSVISMSEYTYVSVGSKRIRKSLVAILIALFALIIAGCAVGIGYYVHWNEVENHQQGTLDVTFEIDEDAPDSSNSSTLPNTPDGYNITSQYSEDSIVIIEYANGDGYLINFTQIPDVENMGVSLDNEDADFNETTINGYKGYTYSKDGINALFWADTSYFYTLQGTCEMDVLYTMIDK